MPTMDMKFKVIGFSTFKGQIKVRFANDLTRVKVLDKGGHTDINLVELPHEMEKPEAVSFLMTTELGRDPKYAEALDAANEKYNGEPVAKKAKAAVLKTGSAKPAAKAKAKTVSGTKKVSDEDKAALLESLVSRANKEESVA